MSRLKHSLRQLYQRVRRRSGHPPGPADVSTMEHGRAFAARPNFYYFEGCGRPCWLPLQPEPRALRGQHVTAGWPCEGYRPHDRHAGPYCYADSPHDGDWVDVIGQVRGQTIRDEVGHTSDIWNVIRVPKDRIVQNADRLGETADGQFYIAYASDLWLGNTGWRGIP